MPILKMSCNNLMSKRIRYKHLKKKKFQYMPFEARGNVQFLVHVIALYNVYARFRDKIVTYLKKKY